MTQRKSITFLSSILVLVMLLTSVPVIAASRQTRNPEAGKKKAAKRIGIGTAIGAGAGGLIGGRKGAVIGAGAGAAGGTAYHLHKKRKYAKRHKRRR